MTALLDGAIMTIFAREILEGTVIIGQYRTVLMRSPEWQDPEKQKQGLRAITMAALLASLVAILVCTAVAIPLAVLSRELNDTAATLIEGISKLVAAICVLQLSLKIPQFLGLYASKKDQDGISIGLSLKSIRFNVAWNIWREVAEIGIFLLPFFLMGEGAVAIPLSGLIGIAVGFGLGAIIYLGNKKLKNTLYLAIFMSLLLLFLSTGLFVGGCHEFEEVNGETTEVYNIGVKSRRLSFSERFLTSEDEAEQSSVEETEPQYTFWSEKKLPMALFKPFGYSAGRTQLQIACFWLWLLLGLSLHAWKYISSKKIREAQELANEEKNSSITLKSLEEGDIRNKEEIEA